MSEDLVGVVVSHGGVAEGLVDAVEKITGINGALVAISNEGCGMEDLGARIQEAAADSSVVLFVDMPVGSCLQAAARCVRTNERRSMVAGVNLPMLIDFCFHRDTSASDAAQRAVSRGKESIKTLGA